jgi:hypothetical protein
MIWEVAMAVRVKDAVTPTKARLWSGSPPLAVQDTTLAPGGTVIKLVPGLYLAESDDGLRHGFAVTRSETIDLEVKGKHPSPAQGPFTFTIDPGDPSADIRVFDNEFRFVSGGTGKLELPRLPKGLYQFRIRVGRKMVEKVILLDRDWPPRDDLVPADVPPVNVPLPDVPPVSPPLPHVPRITSAAPLPGTRMVHEYHEDAARQAQGRFDIRAGEGAELMIMTRIYSTDGQLAAGDLPWRDVAILDRSGNIVGLECDRTVLPQRRSSGNMRPLVVAGCL